MANTASQLQHIVAPHYYRCLYHGPEVATIYNQAKYAVLALPLAVNSQRLAELTGCG